jgi:hypothetical protein
MRAAALQRHAFAMPEPTELVAVQNPRRVVGGRAHYENVREPRREKRC